MNSKCNVVLDTDLSRIDLNIVHDWLSTDAFWALGRDRQTVQQAAEGLLNFGVFDSPRNPVWERASSNGSGNVRVAM
jgi:hypothetical protein